MNSQRKEMRNLLVRRFLLAVISLPVAANGLHPEVPILDAQGTPVVESGLPMSTMARGQPGSALFVMTVILYWQHLSRCPTTCQGVCHLKKSLIRV